MPAQSRGPNHRASVALGLLALGVLLACGHAPGAAATPGGVDPVRAPGAAVVPPQYVVADPTAATVALLLGDGGALGLVVDRMRVVVGRGEPRIGDGVTDEPITGAQRIPGRFGGGYLFWTDTVLYRSASFEGVLEPLAHMPDSIQNISFAPAFLLVRTQNGERWSLGLPRGQRVALDPLGASDVEGLDDGRALAFDDRGSSYASTDHGAHWADVSTQLKGAPQRVARIDDELWLFDDNGGGARLEPDGQLALFDKQPEEKPPEMRAVDPRWRGREPPLRAALRRGASLDDTTAIVIEQGDVVRIDVRTGELTGMVTGKLPPDAQCEAVPVANDVVFACHRRGGSHGSQNTPAMFVVSHTASGDNPVIEQTFAGTLAAFNASDDGGLVVGVACDDGSVAASDVACVRQPNGTWQQIDLSLFGADAGPVTPTVSHWVPRADGHAVAIVSEPAPGIFDPHTGTFTPLAASARDLVGAGSGLRPVHRYRRHASHGGGALLGGGIVDGTWSFAANSNALRSWGGGDPILELTEDGRVLRSPFELDVVAAGASGLGRSADGRFYQSTDHGASWVEVAGPPAGNRATEVGGCSTVGCDLGGFYRMGWAARPPRVEPVARAAKAAPDVRRTQPVAITCRPSGPAVSKVLARSESSDDDLGLGATRLPVAGERSDVNYLRTPLSHPFVSPLHDAIGAGADVDNPSLRGMLTGYATTSDGGALEVMGPNRSASALRRGLFLVAPFDPSATVRKTTLAMSDVIAAGRLAGMTTDEIFQDDMTESGNLVALTPRDASLPAGLVFHNARGLVALVHPNDRVKMAVRLASAASGGNDNTVLSGVSLGGDETALLEVEPSGAEHVFRVGPGGITDLFDVGTRATESTFYPANPDALAIGPRGDLAVVRTGSGSDPASAEDPALLLVSSQPAVALAPWSTLRLADDPSCKDPGWRVTLSTSAPWVRTVNPELRTDPAPMLARVKWSKERVCLEALEVALPDIVVHPVSASGSTASLSVGSWLVARGGTFARVAVSGGVEWRQPLACSLVTKQP